MNLIYVHSYPLYKEYADNGEFLSLGSRDKWMPSLTIQRGYPSELWVVGKAKEESQWQYDDLPPLPVKIFEADQRNGSYDIHTSESLIKNAKNSDADLFILKGADGSVGVQLAKQVLIPLKIPYAIILEGEWYHSILKYARAVFYQTEWQRQQLTRRSFRFWRTVMEPDRVIHLPKSVDARHYAPDPSAEKEYDIVASGRLDGDSEGDYDALFELSKRLRVAFIGGGPFLDRYRRKFPEITWFGKAAYEDIPGLLNKGRLFFYTCYRHSHPLCIAEAAACGIPPVAFSDVIDDDILPEHIGLRVSNNGFFAEITALLNDNKRLEKLSESARNHARKYWHHQSSIPAIREMMSVMRSGSRSLAV